MIGGLATGRRIEQRRIKHEEVASSAEYPRFCLAAIGIPRGTTAALQRTRM